MKISDVIGKICKHRPPVDENHTCDTVKCGDPERECTGVVTTVFASVDVIRKAAQLGANLIVVHEPLFYSHEDDSAWLRGNPVYEEKAALLERHGIVVWRCHDRLHGASPSRKREHMDLVFYGIMKELGWEEFCIGYENKPLLYEIPETTVRDLAAELTAKLGLTGARMVGDWDAKVKRVYFCEHVNGSNWGGRRPDCDVIRKIDGEHFDVMIPLEIVDWTVSAFVRDAAQLGKGKAIIEMGHFNVEELAMKYLCAWLAELLGEQVPVRFVPSGDSFTYFLAPGVR